MMASDESEGGSDDNSLHRRKYQLLLDRCEVLQQDNEKLVNKIHQVRKLLIRCRKQRAFLMDKLDRYHDDWRNTDYSLDIGIDENGHFVDLVNKQQQHKKQFVSRKRIKERNSDGKITKRNKRKERAEKDPNAPKKPPNPFFQYCQEQRSIVLDHMIRSGNTEPSKQEITKQLASNWNGLLRKDKKIYYDMYGKSKERYLADMHQYKANLNTK